MQSILNDGKFFTKISSEATVALKDSIKIRKKISNNIHPRKYITLDFQKVNEEAIKARGNLKVYHALPKGIRVVAR
jgi:hypothetical protein